MDPLAILREYAMSKSLDQVAFDGDRVRFADKYSFQKAMPTAFRAKGGSGDHYSLEAVTLFIQSIVANSNMGAYVAKAVRSRVQQIELRDRETLHEYLTGKIATCEHIADVVPAVTFDEQAAKKQRVEEPAEGDAAALRALFEQEKQLRDRNSLLCAPGADFKPVLAMLDKVLAARRAIDAAAVGASGAKAAPTGRDAAAANGRSGSMRKQQQQPGGGPTTQRPAGSGPAFMKPSGRMERDAVSGGMRSMGADATLAAELGHGYGIQIAPQQQQQQQRVPGSAPTRPEQPPRAASRPSAAAAPPPVVVGAHQQQQQQRQRPSAGSTGGAAASASASAEKRRRSGGGGPPLILVPSGVTALVNMRNARELLAEGRFVRSDEAATAAGGVKPPHTAEFQRRALRSGPRYPRYQLTDRVPRPGHPDWARVVAVVVQGKAWQFKDFPFKGANKGDLMETFDAVFGAYFHYSDEKVPEAVLGWKVAKLPLRRTARHLDNTMVLDFYAKLDAFLASKRCALDY